MSKRVRVQWSPDKSIEGLLSVLNGRYITAVRLLLKNIHVSGTDIDHNLAILGSNVASALKFSSDAAFILTYTNEDGNNAMLDDENDLRDACTTQKLNPLRIIDNWAARDVLSCESIARFRLFSLECEFVLASVMEEIQKDHWTVAADQRASRHTGAAFSVVANLLGVCTHCQVCPIPWPSFITSVGSRNIDLLWFCKAPWPFLLQQHIRYARSIIRCSAVNIAGCHGDVLKQFWPLLDKLNTLSAEGCYQFLHVLSELTDGLQNVWGRVASKRKSGPVSP
jgi:hypothetical protein